jgi:hypothetical protein
MRGRRRSATNTVRAGDDPLRAKREARPSLTFTKAVNRYLEVRLAEFRNDKHRKQWRATLDAYAGPVIGRRPVQTFARPPAALADPAFVQLATAPAPGAPLRAGEPDGTRLTLLRGRLGPG